jgi:hypothetical protein
VTLHRRVRHEDLHRSIMISAVDGIGGIVEDDSIYIYEQLGEGVHANMEAAILVQCNVFICSTPNT